jgi:hypothetical protein
MLLLIAAEDLQLLCDLTLKTLDETETKTSA